MSPDEQRQRCCTKRQPQFSVLLGLALMVSCGGDDVADVPSNAPPTWTDAPASLTLGQGQTKALPLTIADPDGDEITVELTTSSPDLSAELSAGDGKAILVHANYLATGAGELTVDLSDGAGHEVQVKVTLETLPIGWKPSATWDSEGPEAREHGALVVHDASRSVLLIGGSGYNPYLQPLDDVWRYDLDSGSWSQLTPTGDALAGGGSRRVAQIPGTDTAYLFGGYGDNGANHAELYRVDYDGSNVQLTAVPQPDSPLSRALHAFVYDPELDRFIMFGGAGLGPFNDTWTMRIEGGTAVWTRQEPLNSPSQRYGFFYGFDVERGRLIVFSGAQGFNPLDPARDTWVLDVRAEPLDWQLVAEGDLVPEGRRNGCMVFDPSGPRLFVFGGTPDAQNSAPGLFAFDARPGHESWSQLELPGEPPLRSSGFGLYDPTIDQTVLGFGNTTASVFRDWTALGY